MLIRNPSSIFLLSPENAAFLAGTSRKLRDARLSQAAIFGVFALLIGALIVWLILTAVNESRIRERLNQSGVTTQAQIVSHRSVQGRSTSYYLTYRYVPEKGRQPYTREEEVTSDLYSSLADGSTTTALYLPGDPQTARLVENPYDPTRYVIVLGIMLVFVLVTDGVYIRNWWRSKRLEREGELLQGEIVESALSRGKNGWTLSVRYHFVSPLGADVTGRQQRLRSDLKQAGAPQPGTLVAVLYIHDGLHRIL